MQLKDLNTTYTAEKSFAKNFPLENTVQMETMFFCL